MDKWIDRVCFALIAFSGIVLFGGLGLILKTMLDNLR